jgi:hypothetical protein
VPVSPNQKPHPAGLCADCVHARAIQHPHGGAPYWRCNRSDSDPSYPKYPRLPKFECAGYESDAEGDGK